MPRQEAPISGLGYALLSFSIWGLFPIYWKQLLAVPSDVVLAHRIIWGALLMLVVTVAMGQLRAMGAVLRNTRTLLYTMAASILIAINWWLNIFAAQTGRISESSMGYYITPLLSVVVGLVIFQERLRPLQWLAVLFAAAGVSYRIALYEQVPVIALVLAGSFALYGAIKKKVSYPAVAGLTLESWIVMVPAVIYLYFYQGRIVLNDGYNAKEMVMLVLCGPLTLIPLLFFAGAAKRISLTLLSICQYLSPTVAFLIATFIYHEPLDQGRLPAFLGIWAGVILFAAESLWYSRYRAPSSLT